MEDTSMTFQKCGPNGNFPLRLDISEWIADEAYLAGCFAGLNYHGVCRHFLDVEIVPRNSHFLFHKWNIFCCRDLLIRCSNPRLEKILRPPQCFLGSPPLARWRWTSLISSQGKKMHWKCCRTSRANTSELFMQFILLSLLEHAV